MPESRLHSAPSVQVMAAPRDASWYAYGGASRSAYAFHVVADDGHMSACGIPILHDDLHPAVEITRNRCQRPGCKVRWPS